MLDRTRKTFLELHTRKEDLFWEQKMGLNAHADAASRALAEAEVALNAYLQDPAQLDAHVALQKSGGGTPGQQVELAGWVRFFRCYTLADVQARALSAEIVKAEAALARARAGMALGYADPDTGEHVAAGSNRLALLVANDPDARVRKAAHEGLRSVERMVLANGFLELVKLRNRLGRMQGFEDYYDWKVMTAEGMRKREVFARLEAFLTATRQQSRQELDLFAARHGPQALDPWNFLYLRAGALSRELDPYFPFAAALGRWGRSFAAMNVRFRGAQLTVDLVDRLGKYDNGFMHGPGPAWVDGSRFVPARINFSANAVPGAVGAGLRATQTLFHEGGHAAHFANITAGSPCFSVEFPPTSVAYAETQSMFMDALLSDPDWRHHHARAPDGSAMPFGLMERSIQETQPFRAMDTRRAITVPMGERAIYELPEDGLTPQRVLDVLRGMEAEVQGLTSSPRPILAVPHLLSGESSAYYHAYVLAEMAVHQTRAFFLERDGHLADNPRVGPDLAAAYWACGNQKTHDQTLVALTGAPLSADALIRVCNRSVDEAVAEARALHDAATRRSPWNGMVDLDARLGVVHGTQHVCGLTEGGRFEDAAAAFAQWVTGLETAAAHQPGG